MPVRLCACTRLFGQSCWGDYSVALSLIPSSSSAFINWAGFSFPTPPIVQKGKVFTCDQNRNFAPDGFANHITLFLFQCIGVRRTWKRLLDGHCGIVNVKHRDVRFADLPCQIAAVVPAGPRQEGGWTASEWLSRDVRDDCYCLFLLWGICAEGNGLGLAGRAEDGSVRSVCHGCLRGSAGRCRLEAYVVRGEGSYGT